MAQKSNPKAAPETDAEMAATEQIVNADVTTLRPSQRAFLQMLHWLENTATEDTSEKEFSGDDVAAIILADDEAAMWDADELPRINAKVLSGCEIEIFGVEAKFSDDPDITSVLVGPNNRRKMYLLVQSARLNNEGQTKLYKLPGVGEVFTWNTSARFIVTKLYWLAAHGYFDNGRSVKARIEGTRLDGTRSVEKLKPLTMPVMAAETEEPPF